MPGCFAQIASLVAGTGGGWFLLCWLSLFLLMEKDMSRVEIVNVFLRANYIACSRDFPRGCPAQLCAPECLPGNRPSLAGQRRDEKDSQTDEKPDEGTIARKSSEH